MKYIFSLSILCNLELPLFELQILSLGTVSIYNIPLSTIWTLSFNWHHFPYFSPCESVNGKLIIYFSDCVVHFLKLDFTNIHHPPNLFLFLLKPYIIFVYFIVILWLHLRNTICTFVALSRTQFYISIYRIQRKVEFNVSID